MQIVFKAGEVVNIVLDDVDDFSVGIRGATFTIGCQVLKVLHGNKDSSAA
jgi:hypothetical protein